MGVGPVGFSVEQQDLLWGMWRGGVSASDGRGPPELIQGARRESWRAPGQLTWSDRPSGWGTPQPDGK